MLTVGTEWLIEASGCDAEVLRDAGRPRVAFARADGGRERRASQSSQRNDTRGGDA